MAKLMDAPITGEAVSTHGTWTVGRAGAKQICAIGDAFKLEAEDSAAMCISLAREIFHSQMGWVCIETGTTCENTFKFDPVPF